MEVAQAINEALVALEVPPATFAAVAESASSMMADILERPHGNELLVSDLGIFGRPNECLHLLTVHKAKGHEFEAVAVIDAHDGRFPHFTVRNIQDPVERRAQFNESRRVMYVAATRAKRVLMFFTDRTHPNNRPSPFLQEMQLL
jgi:DNA helicase-2/ATP-dependent DNA helicase PcrA